MICWLITLLKWENGGLPYSGYPPFSMVRDRGWLLGGGKLSQWHPLKCGVLQGASVSPHPDCPELRAELSPICWWYLLYLLLDGWVDSAPNILNGALQGVTGWLNQSWLKWNLSKMESFQVPYFQWKYPRQSIKGQKLNPQLRHRTSIFDFYGGSGYYDCQVGLLPSDAGEAQWHSQDFFPYRAWGIMMGVLRGCRVTIKFTWIKYKREDLFQHFNAFF